MIAFRSAIEREMSRLKSIGPVNSEPEGMGAVRFVCHAQGLVDEVVDKAKLVLGIVNQHSLGDWPSDAEWSRLLPAWFVSKCEPTKSDEEAEAWLQWWRNLSEEQKVEVERRQPWSLDGWLYYLTPGERLWFWWDAAKLADHDFVVAVEAHEWPFPSGALQWLLRACGADRVEAEK